VVYQHLDGLELGGRLPGVDVAKGMENAGGQSCGRQRGAEDEFRAVRRRLSIGVVDLPAGCSLGALFVDVVHHADDAGAVAPGVEHLADSVPVGPVRGCGKVFCKCFVDHDDTLALGSVVPGEVAPTDASAHGAQIAGRNDVNEG